MPFATKSPTAIISREGIMKKKIKSKYLIFNTPNNIFIRLSIKMRHPNTLNVL
jgi:hypothetical protein